MDAISCGYHSSQNRPLPPGPRPLPRQCQCFALLKPGIALACLEPQGWTLASREVPAMRGSCRTATGRPCTPGSHSWGPCSHFKAPLQLGLQRGAGAMGNQCGWRGVVCL